MADCFRTYYCPICERWYVWEECPRRPEESAVCPCWECVYELDRDPFEEPPFELSNQKGVTYL